MARFSGLLINPEHQKTIYTISFAAIFTVLLSMCGIAYVSNTYFMMTRYNQMTLEIMKKSTDAAIKALNGLENNAPGACTDEMVNALQAASFAPDGINEFLLFQGDVATCSSTTGKLDQPADLGPPDVVTADASGLRFWFGANLREFGHRGQYGTVVRRGNFAAVLPDIEGADGHPEWLALEGVIWPGKAPPYHANGKMGLFLSNQARQKENSDWPGLKIYENRCEPGTPYCSAGSVSLKSMLLADMEGIILAVLFCALLANFIAAKSRAYIVRAFEFDARFRRNLNYDRVICTYQAIMNAQTSEITGCEVLARWRDIDGSIVFPDRFIPLVEKDRRTLEFTRLVVQKAFAELSEFVPPETHLQVSFNISPHDLADPGLMLLFEPFLQHRDRFDVAIEIVESDRINVVDAERLIQSLRRKGIKTYIDDFGTGYSNMENLAKLSVDAVKLDKSFALAAPNSLMSEMLGFAVQMAKVAGRAVVIEGVETAERFEQLLALDTPVDYLQGYFISRPVDIKSFSAFMTQRSNSLSSFNSQQLCA